MSAAKWMVAASVLAATACAKEREDKDVEVPAQTTAAASAAAVPGIVELKVDGTGLAERAKVTDPEARAAAIAKLPGGSVTAAELEEEDGAFIYSYDVATPGRPGIDEVHVDAITGQVTSVSHEDPAAEKGEAADAQ